jgi:hypothetical protein
MKPELPSSNAFWVLSSCYRDAGDAVLSLIRNGSYSGHAVFACVFLYFRSVELGLKAVLAANGVSEQEIAQKLAHQISPLLKRVEDFVQLSELGFVPKTVNFSTTIPKTTLTSGLSIPIGSHDTLNHLSS